MSSSSRAREEAPTEVGAFFACRGGCGQRYPLEAGYLVMAAGDEPTAYNRADDIRRTDNRPPTAAVALILCETCTAALVLERGRTERRQ